jgi:hypothetical protein
MLDHPIADKPINATTIAKTARIEMQTLRIFSNLTSRRALNGARPAATGSAASEAFLIGLVSTYLERR